MRFVLAKAQSGSSGPEVVADHLDSSPTLVLDPLGIEIGTFAHDPLGFVLFAFPWGEPGTVLEKDAGPEPWQREVLAHIGRSLGGASDAIRIALLRGMVSASRRWWRGSSCGRSPPSATRAGS